LKLIGQIVKNNKLSPVTQFIVSGVLLYIGFEIFYTFLKNISFIHRFYEFGVELLTDSFLYSSKAFLAIFGLDTFVDGKIIRAFNKGGVYLDRGCLGRNLMLLYAGFILVFPGKITSKIWYIPLGLAVIYLLNIIRISALVYIDLCCPQYLDVNHDFIFKYTTYFFIFILWVIWIRKYSAVRNKSFSTPRTTSN